MSAEVEELASLLDEAAQLLRLYGHSYWQTGCLRMLDAFGTSTSMASNISFRHSEAWEASMI